LIAIKSRKPDIKSFAGVLSVAGWRDDKTGKTQFCVTKSLKLKNGEFIRYNIRLSRNQMVQIIDLIVKALRYDIALNEVETYNTLE
jgi:hypothetical protein